MPHLRKGTMTVATLCDKIKTEVLKNSVLKLQNDLDFLWWG